MNNIALSLCLLLASLMCTASSRAHERIASPPLADTASRTDEPAMPVPHSHLSVDSTIGDVIAHPALAGFGHLILPWDDRTPDLKMHLREIGALLPYHSEVNPADIVSALNRMIDDASQGK